MTELKDAIQLAIFDDPIKKSILEANSRKLNEFAEVETKKLEVNRLTEQKASDEQDQIDEHEARTLMAGLDIEVINKNASLKAELQQEMEKQSRLRIELDEATQNIAAQRKQLLDNVKLCFQISRTKVNNIDHLQILHFQLPMDGNYNSSNP